MPAQKAIYLTLIAVALTSCASQRGTESKGMREWSQDKFTADQMINQPIENVDMISLLSRGEDSGSKHQGDAFPYKFDELLAKGNYTKLERNAIQDRLIMASNELCETYKVTLKRKQSRANFWAGTISTAAGALGALAPTESGAQFLAAVSGTSSGVRAEYNQNYYSDLAAQVITKGINARRSDILEKLSIARKNDVDNYTMQAAIADAIIYHGACALVAGLEQADSALVKLNQNAGIDSLNANPFFKKEEERLKDKRANEAAQRTDGSTESPSAQTDDSDDSDQ